MNLNGGDAGVNEDRSLDLEEGEDGAYYLDELETDE